MLFLLWLYWTPLLLNYYWLSDWCDETASVNNVFNKFYLLCFWLRLSPINSSLCVFVKQTLYICFYFKSIHMGIKSLNKKCVKSFDTVLKQQNQKTNWIFLMFVSFLFLVTTPDQVVHRYRCLLKTYIKTMSLSEKLKCHNVDKRVLQQYHCWGTVYE